ncbi:ABC transporter, ATP binding protein [Aeropyrum pernix]|uniref:ABC transporter, ATP binding protein n=1 Tax=Aeropyrum pernix TaxID=56636 RepID=A0A401H8U4_AERPX|nr:ABC transporter, ATP binding protein [Aeropyrum pernix]
MHRESPLRVRVEDLTVAYNGEPVLSGVNLEFRGPGLVQIIGPNGAGKTTLLKAILGLIKPARGRVLLDGVEATGRPEMVGRYAGYVPQNPSAPKLSPMTVREFVETSLRLRGVTRSRERAAEVLHTLGIRGEVLESRLWELSMGMLQRVFIARAIAPDPKMLVMDEPLASVDPAGRMEIARIIAGLARERLVLMTSHEPSLLLGHTDIIVIINRRLIASGPPEEVYREEVLRRVYGESVARGLVLAGEGGAHG